VTSKALTLAHLPTGRDEAVLDTMKALGDPMRWQMLCLVAQRAEIGLGELADAFPLTKSTLSYHVRLLREARLITIRKAGRNRYARLRSEGLAMVVATIQDSLLYEVPSRRLTA
jgi:DNA-binding transcriptional ArsR family regulator